MKQIKQALAGKNGKHVMLRGVDPAKWRSIRSAAALSGEKVPDFVIGAAYARATDALKSKAARA